MGGQYEVSVQIGRQEDGLWRVEVPDLIGCWVDAPTTPARALSELQDVIAMTLDYYEEEARALPLASSRCAPSQPEPRFQ